ncbi:MAG: hypothetical protein HOP10_04075 [Chitinophagaceae bacterium]|nr:hypothetical protein [Chitinophagaceae bacterium]
MKKTLGIFGVIAFCLAIISTNAQTPQTNTEPAAIPATTPVQQTWDPKKNPTVIAITSRYEGKYITARPGSTDADIFPVIGKYESSTNADAASVSIALDGENKGMVWIEGLPQGKIKAMLRRSPAVYKIPAQKTEDGKEIAEGTLIFDKETNTLSINIGKPFKAEDPAAVFLVPVEEPAPAVTTKSKKTKTIKEPKPWIYTGTKVVVEAAAN